MKSTWEPDNFVAPQSLRNNYGSTRQHGVDPVVLAVVVLEHFVKLLGRVRVHWRRQPLLSVGASIML